MYLTCYFYRYPSLFISSCINMFIYQFASLSLSHSLSLSLSLALFPLCSLSLSLSHTLSLSLFAAPARLFTHLRVSDAVARATGARCLLAILLPVRGPAAHGRGDRLSGDLIGRAAAATARSQCRSEGCHAACVVRLLCVTVFSFALIRHLRVFVLRLPVCRE
jgi:hypothetical protein